MSSLVLISVSIAALAPVLVHSGAREPLPAWQQEILEQRHPRSRASIHRSTYPEDEALKEVGRSIALAPLPQRTVYIGMTTTPKRINYIEPTLRSLLNQTQPVIIILNVPSIYNSRRSHWNGARITLPHWLEAMADTSPCQAPCVFIHHVDHDWGPATKLVGTAIAFRDIWYTENTSLEKDALVVAADDDHEWEPFAIATLIAHGYGLKDDAVNSVWTYYSYPFPRGRSFNIPKLCVAQAGDLLAAPAHLLNSLPYWGKELLPNGGRLQSCFFVDDLFFAAFFKTSTNLPVYFHPWRFWLFREVKRRKASGQNSHLTPCHGACSPVTIRFRYPDSLAMGKPRETHNANCMSELQALGWWPTAGPSSEDSICLKG